MIAVGAVIFRNDRLLLIKRRHEPKADYWTLPGGLVEVGENTREALVREVREECNVLVKPTRIVDVIDYVERDQTQRVRYHYVLVDFEAEYISGTAFASSDAVEVKWFSTDELRQANLPDMTRDFLSKHYRLQTKSA
ncbi:MAG: NUDIX hydrolase [bacterium]